MGNMQQLARHRSPTSACPAPPFHLKHATGPPPFFEGWFFRAVKAGAGGTRASACSMAGDSAAGGAGPLLPLQEQKLPAVAAAANATGGGPAAPAPALSVAIGIGYAQPETGAGTDPPAMCFLILQQRDCAAADPSAAVGAAAAATPRAGSPAGRAPDDPAPEVHTMYFSSLQVHGGKDPPGPPLVPPGGPAFVAEAAGPAGRCRVEVSGALLAIEVATSGLEVGAHVYIHARGGRAREPACGPADGLRPSLPCRPWPAARPARLALARPPSERPASPPAPPRARTWTLRHAWWRPPLA
jgi:hypothetical protein